MPRLLALLVLLLATAVNALGAGRELAPRPLIPKPNFIGNNIAVAEAGGRFLTVWEEETRGIYGALSDATGRRVSSSAFLIAESKSIVEMELVGAGDSFALFWTDERKVVYLTDVGLDGRVLRTQRTPLTGGLTITVAWNGDRFLAIVCREHYFYSGRARASLLTRDGTAVLSEVPIDQSATGVHIAGTGDGFLAFTVSRYDFFAYRVARDGSITQAVPAGDLPGAIASTSINDHRLDDHTLLVVTATPDGTMRSSVWNDGVKVREQIIGTQHGGGIAPVALQRGDDGRHLLAFRHGRQQTVISTMLLDDEGTPVSEPQLALEEAVGYASASNGSVILVAHRSRTTGFDPLNTLAIHADGSADAPETVSIHPAPQKRALVAAAGGAMLAVWDEEKEETGTTRIRAATIGRDFDPENVRELVPHGILHGLVGNGTEFLLLYEGFGGLSALRLAYDGAPIGEPVVIGPSTEMRPAVTWAGDRWAIVFSDRLDGGLRYVTVSWGGVASSIVPLHLTDNFVSEVALAYDGSRVHLAWIDADWGIEGPMNRNVFTTRLRRDGRIVDPVPLAIPTETPTTHISMAASGEHVVLLVDESQRTAIHRIAAKTREILSSRALVEQRGRSDVTWNGYEFVAAAGYREEGRSWLAVWRLGAAGDRIDAPRGTPTLANDDRGVSVAATPGYDAVVGMRETDAANGPRAVIYANRELPLLPDPLRRRALRQ